ncbi:hypothetical protein BU14_0153s0006 [Porphyra umbilicalis]|uniref:Uncharacterized protein n=1 Tax=Porphyra umbilicalis TaxID=2786 RepID=A0A1X6P8P3_PORUM|nr:hypothetical protein BU14_0153s0006 [Porphyra umbilicalis]|eukprot:OSX77262.1 hypothetical protein BU14_0153s0006 [Porphyra umbilicalis]
MAARPPPPCPRPATGPSPRALRPPPPAHTRRQAPYTPSPRPGRPAVWSHRRHCRRHRRRHPAQAPPPRRPPARTRGSPTRLARPRGGCGRRQTRRRGPHTAARSCPTGSPRRFPPRAAGETPRWSTPPRGRQ